MSYDLSIQDNQDYIKVVISGDRIPGQEVADISAVLVEVAEYCKEKNSNKVLGVINLSGRLPTMASLNIINTTDSFGWDRKFKFALYDMNDDSRKDNLFTETVATNRGFQLKVFDNEQDANKWLLNQ